MLCKPLLAALFGALLIAPSEAQTYRDSGGTVISAVIAKPAIVTPLGYCQLSVTSAALTSTCSGGIPPSSTYALICNEGSAARWRDDGIAPTASVGVPLATGSASAPICSTFFTTFSTLQWIAQSGTTLLDISFYR